MEDQYYYIQRRTEIKDTARELRRKYLRYKDAELVYSIQHKKHLELADRAGAIYRIDGYVLINRVGGYFRAEVNHDMPQLARARENS